MKKEEIITKIVCPKCGREYLPAEIFFPDNLLGRPTDIIRDDAGKIIFFSGTTMDLTEEFTCDCGCCFKVEGNISFNIKTDPNKDFDEDYIVKIK